MTFERKPTLHIIADIWKYLFTFENIYFENEKETQKPLFI